MRLSKTKLSEVNLSKVKRRQVKNGNAAYCNVKEKLRRKANGRAFHTLTRGFHKPFDKVLNLSMIDTMRFLCENIQGCVLGYTQSDEITLVLVDYKKLTSDPWFGYEVQKLCSIGASMATVGFNNAFSRRVEDYGLYNRGSVFYHRYLNVLEAGAMFDCRAFNVPREEVTNNIYWRQLDASRNSIQMLGQAHFTHKELQNKNCSEIQDMLMTQKGINWNDLPVYQKRGTCCVKRDNSIKRASCEAELERTKIKLRETEKKLQETEKKYDDLLQEIRSVFSLVKEKENLSKDVDTTDESSVDSEDQDDFPAFDDEDDEDEDDDFPADDDDIDEAEWG